MCAASTLDKIVELWNSRALRAESCWHYVNPTGPERISDAIEKGYIVLLNDSQTGFAIVKVKKESRLNDRLQIHAIAAETVQTIQAVHLLCCQTAIAKCVNVVFGFISTYDSIESRYFHDLQNKGLVTFRQRHPARSPEMGGHGLIEVFHAAHPMAEYLSQQVQNDEQSKQL